MQEDLAEFLPKPKINPCEEFVAATHFSLHKAGKRSASELGSMVHSDKELADEIKRLRLRGLRG